ncbi:PI-PLC X domain-containing protein 1-like [Chelonus insularis]|uniref:PI-PLC X domain-containing protein 1-like n=1 Tax=Chelonus insularis TaxID=460826 RepID=UPI00158DFEA4|nr:PI-PLC X domain-containing protein 1-like [Chelonus insularis]
MCLRIMKSFIIWLFIHVYFSSGRTIESCHNESEIDKIEMGIVISPLMSTEMIREIGIYWKNINIQTGDVIKLFKGDPSTKNKQEIFQFMPVKARGFQKTGISADFVPTSNLTYHEQCLQYYVSWITNDAIKKTTCLSTHPNWMGQRKTNLGQLKMKDIFIPGTHDSAAYSKLLNFKSEMLVDKYTITQDEDILAQLIYGTRYLDIRVGRYPNNKMIFWGNHGLIRIVPLQNVIDDVKLFLGNTDEIVIFDVQEFPVGFKSIAAHNELLNYLEREFHGYYLERPINVWRTTLEDIWSTGKRLIISYDYASIVSSSLSVWPQVEQQWGNVRTLDDLYTHLNGIETKAGEENSYTSRLGKPRAAMAQLTPTTFDVIFNRLGGLRLMAENVDMHITEWYSEVWQHTANVVAVDFIKATGIIETAIKWNDKRISGCYTNLDYS